MAVLAEQIYEDLVNMIVEENYKPGDRFPSENVLCERFSVSRNTLRAALNKLHVLGLTETRQGGGTYLKEVNSDVYLNFFMPAVLTSNIDLLEVMEFRRGIEVESARLAAENATETDIQELREYLEECRDNLHNMSSFEAANNEFHFAIAKASKSKMFIRMESIIHQMISTVMQKYLSEQGADIDSTFYHEMVMRCIIEHKPDEAAYFMDRHMQLLVERVKNYITEEKTNKGEK
jgi:GntR family transcriptional regulator, transcriptional repressor for pyruvate dehydrogenase complex